MPVRLIREGILTSARVAKLDFAEEVFFRRLMSVVDDFARYYGDASMLRAACYPRQLNKVSDNDIESWLQACIAAGLLVTYIADDGERYVEMLRFGQQARAKVSKYPDPSAVQPTPVSTCEADVCNREQSKTNVHLDVDVFEDVFEDEDVKDNVRLADVAEKSQTAPTPTPKAAPDGADPPGFLAFWSAYPNTGRKVGKGKCAGLWRTHRLEPKSAEIVAHVQAMRHTDQWRCGYEPAPTTYLSQRRYADPVPRAGPRNEARAYLEETLGGTNFGVDDGSGNEAVAGDDVGPLRRRISA